MVELLYISMVSSKKQLLLDIKAGAFGCLIESINFQDAEHVSEINVECIKLMLAFRRVLNPILLAESRKQKAESRKQKAESENEEESPLRSNLSEISLSGLGLSRAAAVQR